MHSVYFYLASSCEPFISAWNSVSCKNSHEGMLLDSNAEDKIVVVLKETTL